ncbi:alpha/beta hydrolase [Microtetraspora sp. NBRC 13810]|uniref:alpha/beta hydrolase n=1 Tax=Microtetraspora sp. NBRC 13810 TaxID=3030990 RepID=UPI0024A31C16|nr:alpha/beta hydrolase [Microtetraspora sp. NBRC 13810]GLW06853.1 alpha/beta hydrolase [Microtetraspora sp. NBRC 13810]
MTPDAAGTFVLVPGAAADSWYWGPLAAELRARGHDVITPDLPCDDDSAGLREYADAVVDAVVDAVGGRTGLVVVAHSFGGFTAPLVCERVPAGRLVLLSAMVPAPGETPGEWWGATGWEQARREQDERDGRAPGDDTALFFHDVPPELAAQAVSRARAQSATPFAEPWPLAAWPAVPTTYLLCRDDRFLPAGFVRRLVGERLGLVPDEIDGGHNVALSRPGELADRLAAYGGPGSPRAAR